jgi:predicted membrane metal-binding protein
MTLLPQTIRSKRTSGALSCSRALKCSLLSVHIGTITHALAISGQHVAVLAALIYFALRAFAVPTSLRIPMTLALIWLYIVVAGAPPSTLRARVIAILVLGARFFGRQVSPVR